MRYSLIALGIWLFALCALAPVSAAENGDGDQAAAEGDHVQGPRVAVFTIGAFSEQPSLGFSFFGAQPAPELRAVTRRIRMVADDPEIVGVVLVPGAGSPNLAQAAELRAALATVLATGRKVHAFGENLETGQYLAMAEADLIALAPGGSLWLTGLHLEVPYLAELLAHLRIEAQFLHVGDFKTAAEPFTRQGPSDEALAMQEWLLDSLYTALLEPIAAGRERSREQVEAAVDAGPLFAAAAVERALVDVAEHRLAFENRLRLHYGEKLVFVRDYGAENETPVDTSNPLAVFSQMAMRIRNADRAKEGGGTVAVVRIVGPIVDRSTGGGPLGGSGEQASAARLVPVLNALVDDEDIAAVVLRIDSPGGSASASEAILAAAREVAGVKPVVVSMGAVAGSGGYYVACTGGEIFAEASTLTGSIGVVGGKMVTTRMWQTVGVDWHSAGRGEHHDLYASARAWNDEEQAVVAEQLATVYELFEQRVTSARAGKLSASFAELAGGRVFTGAQAHERGLVDHLGGLHAAILRAAELAELEGYPPVIDLPHPRHPLAALMGRNEDGAERHLDAWVPAVWQALGALDPQRGRQVLDLLVQLQLLREQGVVLAMPPLAVRTRAGG